MKLSDEIKKLTQAIRDNDDINYGTIISLKLIDDKSEQFEQEKQELIDMYKGCFEKYIPDNLKDEATLFLSTYNNELAKYMATREL